MEREEDLQSAQEAVGYVVDFAGLLGGLAPLADRSQVREGFGVGNGQSELSSMQLFPLSCAKIALHQYLNTKHDVLQSRFDGIRTRSREGSLSVSEDDNRLYNAISRRVRRLIEARNPRVSSANVNAALDDAVNSIFAYIKRLVDQLVILERVPGNHTGNQPCYYGDGQPCSLARKLKEDPKLRSRLVEALERDASELSELKGRTADEHEDSVRAMRSIVSHGHPPPGYHPCVAGGQEHLCLAWASRKGIPVYLTADVTDVVPVLFGEKLLVCSVGSVTLHPPRREPRYVIPGDQSVTVDFQRAERLSSRRGRETDVLDLSRGGIAFTIATEDNVARGRILKLLRLNGLPLDDDDVRARIMKISEPAPESRAMVAHCQIIKGHEAFGKKAEWVKRQLSMHG